MRKLRQFLRLDGRERRMLIVAMVLLPVIGLLLRVAGLRRTRETLDKLVSVARPVPDCSRMRPESKREMALRTASLVSIAADRGPWKATCLTQSLVSRWLLARREIPVELRIGVRTAGGALEAHAWVEYAGEALPCGFAGFIPFGHRQSGAGDGPRELET
jgi:hypothetical protein